MATVTAQNQKWLLRKFHTICSRLNMTSDMKMAVISGYGVESSKDMSNTQLIEACEYLEGLLNPEAAKASKMRKRVIGAIGGWLKLIGKEGNIEYIKSIACRATGVEHFNQISLERLRSIYSMFLKKQKDARSVNKVCGEISYKQHFSGDLLN